VWVAGRVWSGRWEAVSVEEVREEGLFGLFGLCRQQGAGEVEFFPHSGAKVKRQYSNLLRQQIERVFCKEDTCPG
jgi:hypothetical protein